MRETYAIVAAAARLRERRIPYLVATVVSVQGSSYRRPGARLLITEEGRVAGNVSGGCLERDLIRTGFWRTRSGPVVIRYDSTDSEGTQAALGCGGIVEILLEAWNGEDDSDPLGLAAEAVASGRRALVATVFRSTDPNVPVGARWPLAPAEIVPEHAASREMHTADGTVEVLVEPIVPPPRLFLLGSGFDAEPVAAAARQLGWGITVWDPSPSFTSRARFDDVETDLEKLRTRIDASDRALVVIMGHHVENDRAALRMALASRAEYIGILGPRHRSEKLGPLEDPRIHAPVGLDLGAETPEEIALAIAAEMLASLRRRNAGSLGSGFAITGPTALPPRPDTLRCAEPSHSTGRRPSSAPPIWFGRGAFRPRRDSVALATCRSYWRATR
ncbi:XdhC family protein [Pendulispora brunnea]|uniref:XdhC family protein n=1 Tax=Pendulispora brunnea TaxID=2905690 RepID=A0ABZ2JXJ9_9BACT